MVGTDDLTPFITAADSTEALCQSFEDNLKTLGRFTLKFAMRDEGNIRDNAFFFCGRQPRGFEKIKEAMWKLDPEYGNEFSAHADGKTSDQVDLFAKSAQTSRLSTLLVDKFRGAKDISIESIFKWVIEDTSSYLPKHARLELERLLERNAISYTDPQASNRKRRKNDWPPRILVTFK